MWFDLAAGWRKYNASLAVWGLRFWPLFGVESQPLLGVSKRIAGIGRDSVPSSLAVVESLTASRSPVVGRFDCILVSINSLNFYNFHFFYFHSFHC